MDITKEVVRAALADNTIQGDGHGIVPPEHYEAHFPLEVLEGARLVTTHHSDPSSHKSMIFGPDGAPVESMDGVYNLYFLYWLGREAGVQWPGARGRGSEARQIVSALREWVAA